MWRAATDARGRTYYYNSLTKETSWKPPAAGDAAESPLRRSAVGGRARSSSSGSEGSAQISARSGSSGQWKKAVDAQSGKPYFYTKVTETSWTLPPGWDKASAAAPETVPPLASARGGWRRVLDPRTGRHYFYHKGTRATSWRAPPGWAEPDGGSGPGAAGKESGSGSPERPRSGSTPSGERRRGRSPRGAGAAGPTVQAEAHDDDEHDTGRSLRPVCPDLDTDRTATAMSARRSRKEVASGSAEAALPAPAPAPVVLSARPSKASDVPTWRAVLDRRRTPARVADSRSGESSHVAEVEAEVPPAAARDAGEVRPAATPAGRGLTRNDFEDGPGPGPGPGPAPLVPSAATDGAGGSASASASARDGAGRGTSNGASPRMMPSPRTLASASFDASTPGTGASAGGLAAFAASAASALPPGWKRVLDPSSGKHYYYRKDTREVRWQPPIPMAALHGAASNEFDGVAPPVELRTTTNITAVAGAANDTISGSSPALAAASDSHGESCEPDAASARPKPRRVSVTVASRRTSLSSEGRPASPPPPTSEVVAAAVAAAEEEEAAMERAVAAAGAAEAAARRAARQAARGSASPAIRRSSADKRKARGSGGSAGGGNGSNALGKATLLDAPAPRHRTRNFAVSAAAGAGFPEVRILDLRGMADAEAASAAADDVHLLEAREQLPAEQVVSDAGIGENVGDDLDAGNQGNTLIDDVLAAATAAAAAAASGALPAGGDITPVRVSTPTPSPRPLPFAVAVAPDIAAATSPSGSDLLGAELVGAELEPVPRAPAVPQLVLPASALAAPGQNADSARTVVTLRVREDSLRVREDSYAGSGSGSDGDTRSGGSSDRPPVQKSDTLVVQHGDAAAAAAQADLANELTGLSLSEGSSAGAGGSSARSNGTTVENALPQAGSPPTADGAMRAPVVHQPFTPLATIPAGAQRLDLAYGGDALGSDSLASVLRPAPGSGLPQYQSNLQPSPCAAFGASPRTPPAVHVPALPSAIKRPNLRLVLQQHAIEATAHRAAERARSAARLAVPTSAAGTDSGSSGSVVRSRSVTPTQWDASSAASAASGRVTGFLPADLPGAALSPSSASLQLTGLLWKRSRSGLRRGAWQPRFWVTHRWLLLYYGSDTDSPDVPLGLFDLRSLTDLRLGEEVLTHRVGSAMPSDAVAADEASASGDSLGPSRSRSGSLSQRSARSSTGSSSAAASAPAAATAAAGSGKRSSLWRSWLGLGAGSTAAAGASAGAERTSESAVRAALKELGVALHASSHDGARDADVSASAAAHGSVVADAETADELACLLELEGASPMGSVLLKAASPADAARWHASIVAICERYGCAAAAGSCLRDAVSGQAPRRSISTAAHLAATAAGPASGAVHPLSASAVFSDCATSSSGGASASSSRRGSGSRSSADAQAGTKMGDADAAAKPSSDAHAMAGAASSAPRAAPAAATRGRHVHVRASRQRQRLRHRAGLPFPVAAPAAAAARREDARPGRRRKADVAARNEAAAPPAASVAGAGWSLAGLLHGLRALGFVQASDGTDGRTTGNRGRRASANAQRLPQARRSSASSSASSASQAAAASRRPSSAGLTSAFAPADDSAVITPVRAASGSASDAHRSEGDAQACVTPLQPVAAAPHLPPSGGSSARSLRGSAGPLGPYVDTSGHGSARSSHGDRSLSAASSGPEVISSLKVANAMRDVLLQTPVAGESVSAVGSSAATPPGPQSLARLSARRGDFETSATRIVEPTVPEAAVTPSSPPWPAIDALPTVLVAPSALHGGIGMHDSGLSSLAVSPATPMTASATATPHTAASATATPMVMSGLSGAMPQAVTSYGIAGGAVLAAAPGIAFALSSSSAPPSVPPSAPSSARASPSALSGGEATAPTSGQLLPPRRQSVPGSGSSSPLLQLHGEQAKADALERGRRLAALLAERREDARARVNPQPARRDSAGGAALDGILAAVTTSLSAQAAADRDGTTEAATQADATRAPSSAQFPSTVAADMSAAGATTLPAAAAVVTVDLAAYLPLLMSGAGSAAASPAHSPGPEAVGADTSAHERRLLSSAAVSAFPPVGGMLLIAPAQEAAGQYPSPSTEVPAAALLKNESVSEAAPQAVTQPASTSESGLASARALEAVPRTSHANAPAVSMPWLALPAEAQPLLRAPQPSPAGSVATARSMEAGVDTARLPVQGVQIDLVPSTAAQPEGLLVPKPPAAAARSPVAKLKPQPLLMDDVETVIDAVTLLASLQQAPSPRAGVVAMAAAGGQVPSLAAAASAPLVLPPTGNGIMRLRAGLSGRAAALQRRCAALMTEQSARLQAVVASAALARRVGRMPSAAGVDRLPLDADAHAQRLAARLVLHLRAQPEAAAQLGASLLRSDDVARWARFAAVGVAGLPFAPPSVFLRILAAATEQARSLATAAVAKASAAGSAAAHASHATGRVRGLPLHALTGPAGTAASLLHELEAALPLWLALGPCHFAPAVQGASSALVSPGRALLASALGPLQMAASQPATRLVSACTATAAPLDGWTAAPRDAAVQPSAAVEAVSSFIRNTLLSPDSLSAVPWPAAAAIYILYTDAGPDEAVAALARALLPPPFAAACAVAAADTASPASVGDSESAVAARHTAAASAATAASDILSAAAWPSPPASGVMSPDEHAAIRCLLAAGAAAVSLLGLRVGGALLPPDSIAAGLFHPDHDDWLVAQLQDATAACVPGGGQSAIMIADAAGLESQARAIADRLAADLTGGTSAAICPPRELACRSMVSAGDLAVAARGCVGVLTQAEGASGGSAVAEALPWLRPLASALDAAGWTTWMPQAALTDAAADATATAADAFACIELRLDGSGHEQAPPSTADAGVDALAAAQQLLELPSQLPAARLDSLRSSLVRLQAFAAETGVSSTPRAGAGSGGGSFTSVSADTSARLRLLPPALRSELIRCAYEVTSSSQDMSAALVEEELLADASALVEAAAVHLRAQQQGPQAADAFSYCGSGAAPGRLQALVTLVASSDATAAGVPVGQHGSTALPQAVPVPVGSSVAVPAPTRSRSRSSSSSASASASINAGAAAATDLDADAPLLHPPPPPRSAANPLRTMAMAAAAHGVAGDAGLAAEAQAALGKTEASSAGASVAGAEAVVAPAPSPSPSSSPPHCMREPSSRRSVARGRGLPASASSSAAASTPAAAHGERAGEIYTRTLATLSGEGSVTPAVETIAAAPQSAAAEIETQQAAAVAASHTVPVFAAVPVPVPVPVPMLPPMRDFLHGFDALRPAMPVVGAAPSTARTGATGGGAATSSRGATATGGGGGGTARRSSRRDSVQSSGGVSAVSISSVASAAVLSPASAPVTSLASALAALAAARSPVRTQAAASNSHERLGVTLTLAEGVHGPGPSTADDSGAGTGIPTAVVSLADLAAAFAADGDGDEDEDEDGDGDDGGGVYDGAVQQPLQDVRSRRSATKRGHHSLAPVSQSVASFPWAGLGSLAAGKATASSSGASVVRPSPLHSSASVVPPAATTTAAEPLHAKAAVVHEGASLELPRLQPETDSDSHSSGTGSRSAAFRLQHFGYPSGAAAGGAVTAPGGSYSSRSLSPRLGPRSTSPQARAIGPRTPSTSLLGSPTLLSYGMRSSPAVRQAQAGTPAGQVSAGSASASSAALTSPPPALPVLSASLFSPSFPPARVGVGEGAGVAAPGGAFALGLASLSPAGSTTRTTTGEELKGTAPSQGAVSAASMASAVVELSPAMTTKPKLDAEKAGVLMIDSHGGPAIPRLAVEALVGREKAPAVVAAAALSPAPRPRPQTVSLLHYASSPARVPQLHASAHDSTAASGAAGAAASGRSTTPGHSVRFASQHQAQQSTAGAAGASTGRSPSVDSPQLRSALRHAAAAPSLSSASLSASSLSTSAGASILRAAAASAPRTGVAPEHAAAASSPTRSRYASLGALLQSLV